jgi:hypothetical protein
MNNNFQTPNDFDEDVLINTTHIVYQNLHEISQGGPVIGTLSINNSIIPDHLFGGPILFENGFIYAPVYVRKFFGSGFKLAIIDVDTLSTKILGNIKSLIFLDKIEDNHVCFFENVDKTQYCFYSL